MTSYVSQPRVVPNKIEERRYQMKMAHDCLISNTLLILPTGLGKTVVAVLVAANILEKGKKVLILAPTKPLVDQHNETFSSLLSDTRVGIMNGNIVPLKRLDIFNENDVIISTPQTVANDLEKGRYDLSSIGLIIYDEAHRSIGNYAYVSVAEHYRRGLSLGMTASPGSNLDKMEEVCLNLSLVRVDMRDENDPDVSPYIHDVFVNRIEVNMPDDIVNVIRELKSLSDRYSDELVHMRLMDPNWPISTKHLLVIGESLRKRLNNGEKTAIVFRGLIIQSICIKLLHAIGLAETQGMTSLKTYMSKLNDESEKKDASKSTKELVSSKNYIDAWHIVYNTKVEHPKISRVMSLVSKELNSGRDTRIMVFTQYRETCDILIAKLSGINGVRAGKLIGQSKGGLKQKEQMDVLDKFRSGEINVMVSTSVGEEGLDITSTDMVVFYEPVPSEIRTIQRRGRTGRKSNGEVYVLIAKGTRDEVFENTSSKKEELMRSRLDKLNYSLNRRPAPPDGKQRSISEF